VNTHNNIFYALFRYTFGTIGLFLVALGVALSIISNLGTSPLSCPAYVVTGTFGLTVGNWTILINMIYMVIQLVVLRKRFHLRYLMQIPASIVFGYLIDFSLLIFQWLHPASFTSRILLIIASCAISAFGISIEVIARGWMLSAELAVYAISSTIHKPFGTIKVIMDSSLVVISALIAFLMYNNPFGAGEYQGIIPMLTGQMANVVIGLGTLMMALLIGWMMKFTDPIIDKMMDKLIDITILKKYDMQ